MDALNIRVIAKKYAVAIEASARKRDPSQLKDIYRELILFVGVLKQHQDLQLVFNLPCFSEEAKLAVIKDMSVLLSLSPFCIGIFELLIKSYRFHLPFLSMICDELKELILVQENLVSLTIESAFELSGVEKTEIESADA